MPVPLLLDTDLGSDIDDEFALAMIWGSPEVELLGVCTSYGDSALRARIALRMAQLSGRRLVVAPGEATTRSGREVWWAGHEGDAYGDLSAIELPRDGTGSSSAGVRLLTSLARSRPGAHLLAIGPLTSVAAALDHDPAFERDLGGLWLMGGDFADPASAEHNIASDVAAAARVFSAGVPTTVIGVDITRRVRLYEDTVRRIEGTGELGRILAAQSRAWMARWDEDFELPHDPLTLLALLRPELFEFSEPGRVEVADGSDGRVPGCTTHRPGEGAVRIATDVDVPAAAEELADRIVRGLAPTS